MFRFYQTITFSCVFLHARSFYMLVWSRQVATATRAGHAGWLAAQLTVLLWMRGRIPYVTIVGYISPTFISPTFIKIHAISQTRPYFFLTVRLLYGWTVTTAKKSKAWATYTTWNTMVFWKALCFITPDTHESVGWNIPCAKLLHTLKKSHPRSKQKTILEHYRHGERLTTTPLGLYNTSFSWNQDVL